MSHVEVVVIVGLEPLIGLVDEFVKALAAMVAGDRLMQVPPDPFDGVRLRGILGEEVNFNPMAPFPQILLDCF